MVEKNLKKLKAKKRRVMNGFNTGTRDMKLKTAYQRKKRWSADDAGHFLYYPFPKINLMYISQRYRQNPLMFQRTGLSDR